MISGMHRRKCIGKLQVERMSTSPNQCCYFTLQNETVAMLLH